MTAEVDRIRTATDKFKAAIQDAMTEHAGPATLKDFVKVTDVFLTDYLQVMKLTCLEVDDFRARYRSAATEAQKLHLEVTFLKDVAEKQKEEMLLLQDQLKRAQGVIEHSVKEFSGVESDAKHANAHKLIPLLSFLKSEIRSSYSTLQHFVSEPRKGFAHVEYMFKKAVDEDSLDYEGHKVNANKRRVSHVLSFSLNFFIFIMYVIINRIKRSRFPSTLRSIL